MRDRALAGQSLLAFGLSLLVLTCLIGWLENVHIYTTNGLYKSIEAEPWIADPAHARLDPSNYLYFPLYGALARLLDWAGILRGVAWKQFAYLNAFWASLGVALVYAFVWRMTESKFAAALASLFHFGTGFFLLLAVINEDIMPGYVLVLASMALAGLWFDKPDYGRIVIVAVVFTLGWLIEWRLIFPTLPALVLALAIAEGPWKTRARWIAALLVSIVAVTGIVQQVWEGHNGAMGLHDLLWTGKGVDSGWGGFGWDKLWLMLSGLGNYFLLVGGYESSRDAMHLAGFHVVSILLQLAIFSFCAVLLWPRRNDPKVRAIAVVFLGTLGAGQVMNIYSQPADPQMQINVMPWLTVAWALLVASVLARRARMFAVLAVLSLLPLAWNVHYLARQRGQDAVALATLDALEKRFPPASTVYLYWGFEPLVTWQYALWSHDWDWDDKPPAIGQAPSDRPKFKWISVDAGAVRHPQWTADQDAQSLKRDIGLALDRGYRVIASDVWGWSREELASQLATLSAGNRSQAIYDVLHREYEGAPVFQSAKDGTFYELKRRAGS